jgi:hypothetical protein
LGGHHTIRSISNIYRNFIYQTRTNTIIQIRSDVKIICTILIITYIINYWNCVHSWALCYTDIVLRIKICLICLITLSWVLIALNSWAWIHYRILTWTRWNTKHDITIILVKSAIRITYSSNYGDSIRICTHCHANISLWIILYEVWAVCHW